MMTNTMAHFSKITRVDTCNDTMKATKTDKDVVDYAKRLHHENEMLRLEIAKSLCSQAGYKAQIDAFLKLHAS